VIPANAELNRCVIYPTGEFSVDTYPLYGGPDYVITQNDSGSQVDIDAIKTQPCVTMSTGLRFLSCAHKSRAGVILPHSASFTNLLPQRKWFRRLMLYLPRSGEIGTTAS